MSSSREGIDMLSKRNRRTARAEQEGTHQRTSTSMPFEAEIAELRNISERLVHLAEDHPTVAETLLTIAASVSNAGTLLAVLLETRVARNEAPSRR
jgi:hypothetical protein